MSHNLLQNLFLFCNFKSPYSCCSLYFLSFSLIIMKEKLWSYSFSLINLNWIKSWAFFILFKNILFLDFDKNPSCSISLPMKEKLPWTLRLSNSRKTILKKKSAEKVAYFLIIFLNFCRKTKQISC